MAYTFDVYRGRVQPETNLRVFATYIAFFPQLVAGPIERAPRLLPQFHKYFQFDYDRVVSGLRLVLWGVFKKVVIADRVAVYVNGVYNDVHVYSGQHYVIATFFFTFQIYCDFSGYSDIAIGSARILGFDLMENFRQPYFALSIREFWRRWHISLSTWFRDYVYIPLGGNQVVLLRQLLNLMVVFVVSGLWHGANWTFVVWGILHGGFVVVETIYIRWDGRPRLRQGKVITIWQWLITFIAVCFTWIFFRANSLDDAWHIITHLFEFGKAQLVLPVADQRFDGNLEYLLNVILIMALLFIEWQNTHKELTTKVLQNRHIRWATYYGAIVFIFISVTDNQARQQFIYFRF